MLVAVAVLVAVNVGVGDAVEVLVPVFVGVVVGPMTAMLPSCGMQAGLPSLSVQVDSVSAVVPGELPVNETLTRSPAGGDWITQDIAIEAVPAVGTLKVGGKQPAPVAPALSEAPVAVTIAAV